MPKNQICFQPSGRLYLMVAILIFGAANAVTRKLTEIGASNLVDGRNPISFCNVLFVGNLCALILLFFIYQRQWRPSILRQISGKQWLTLTGLAVLSSAVVPTLIFTALSITSVNNVVLISQIDTPLVLFLSILLLGERVNGWVVSGAITAFAGVALTVFLQSPNGDMISMDSGLEIGVGELLTLLAAVFQAISNLISKVSLQQTPLGIFNLYRMVVGTVVFFMATTVLYGPEHFMDVTSPFLWQWMLIYAAVIVVGGQLAWFSGLKHSTASEVSAATAFTPLAGIFAAFLILGELPTVAQYVGGTVIMIGIGLNQVGIRHLNQSAVTVPSSKEAMGEKIAFKGI